MTSANKPSEMLAGGVLRDWQRVSRDRRGLWLATALELVGLLVFVAFFNIIAPPLNSRLQDWPLIAIGLLMSLVPAILWLLFFYQMDRLEPEPKRKVINIFVIAALLTAGLAYPLLHKIFVIESWLYHTWWTQLLGSILIVGVAHMLVVYLAIRYGIYFDPEFDERVDGVIYATAAGLGVATVLNFVFIFRHGGVDLDVGSIRMVINALAYASCAGILGYALGQTRFEKTPFYYLPFAFLLAAALNGLFFFLEDRVSMQGLQAQDSNGLILATVFALITLLIIFWLIRRANEETLRLSQHTPAPRVRRPRPATAPAAKSRSQAPAPTKPPAPTRHPTVACSPLPTPGSPRRRRRGRKHGHWHPQ